MGRGVLAQTFVEGARVETKAVLVNLVAVHQLERHQRDAVAVEHLVRQVARRIGHDGHGVPLDSEHAVLLAHVFRLACQHFAPRFGQRVQGLGVVEVDVHAEQIGGAQHLERVAAQGMQRFPCGT